MNIFENMRNNLNNFSDVAGGQTSMSSGTGAGMTPQVGNPMFRSQIDIKVAVSYSRAQFQSTNNVQTLIRTELLPVASLPERNKVSLPVFMFGNSDFAANYARSANQKRSANWNFVDAVVIKGLGDSIPITSDIDPAFFTAGGYFEAPSVATTIGKAKRGDIVLRFIDDYIVDATHLNVIIAEVILSCPQVAYATLLDSLSSDTFSISGFRYTVQDVTKISQFDNAVDLMTQSMFGKLATDSINPNSMKLPSNQQDNIIDIPLTYGFDKNKVIITEINYDCTAFTWSLFIPTVQKIKA